MGVAMGKINILGTDYEIIYKEQHEDKSLASNDGYCDTSVYKIVVDTMNSTKGDLGAKKDLDSYRKKLDCYSVSQIAKSF